MVAIIVTTIICFTAVLIMAMIISKAYKDDPAKTIDVNVQGFLLTKSDRINNRIEQFAKTVYKQNNLIDVNDFKKFVKSVQILVAQELTYRGNTNIKK